MKKYVDADHLTYQELFDKITSYKGDWKEQKLCKSLIKQYKLGQRYERRNK